MKEFWRGFFDGFWLARWFSLAGALGVIGIIVYRHFG